jgi:phosphoenolpyruvate-protein kinase (PTS system EI component)
MGYASLVDKRMVTKNRTSANFDKEIDNVIIFLEEVAEALEDYCYNDEAQVVQMHLSHLKNPIVRGRVKTYYSKEKISPDTCVSMLMEKMAEEFQNPRSSRIEREWYLPESV